MPWTGLKNWRVRSRLFLLVAIPTLVAVAAGGIFIASSVQSALVNQRTLTLANLSDKITGLAQALQSERQDVVLYIVLGSGGGGRGATARSAIPNTFELAKLNQDYATTDAWGAQVKSLVGAVGGAYSTLAQQDTSAALTAIGNLADLRTAATTTALPAPEVISKYATAIASVLSVESQIAVGSSDSTLAGAVRVLGLVSSMKEETSRQQALLTSTLGPDLVSLGNGGFSPATLQAITEEQAQQQGNLTEFDTAATLDQRQLLDGALSTPSVQGAQNQEQQAIALASSGSRIATDPTVSDASSELSYVVGGMRAVEQQFSGSVTSRAAFLHGSAITSTIIYSIAVVMLLAIALAATLIIGRSMVGPLRRLRNGALEVAEVRLPETVSRMNGADAAGVDLTIEPIDVDSLDEIGEVARAFDQVHTEAVRLAANEAALRGNVNAMFINLSRRTQSLVERLIRVITKLEQSEQDSERLADLFQADHLATRMRRNSENLLVLAGQEFSRRWGQPVPLVDVIRAAVSEIEQYERVTLNVEPGTSIRRDAVRDVVHLVAELAENATSFSAAETPVTIEAYPLQSGGVLIDIADQGVGMRPEAMAQANYRLDNPPTVDVEVSRRMGLFVVAQLASRHGIRIRLRPAAPAGLSALVWLPSDALTRQAASAGPQQGLSSRVTPGSEHNNGGMNGRAGSPPAPELQTEHMGMADTAKIRRRMRAGGIVAPREPSEPERWGGHRRTEAPLAAPAISVPPAPAPPVHASPDVRQPGWAETTMPGEIALAAPDPRVASANGNANERLPIYEAVETDWFQGGRPATSQPEAASAGPRGDWTSPADDGWRAAEVAKEPTVSGATQSGLPKRAPGTNLVPGTVAASPAVSASRPLPPPVPSRSAAENRSRFASYQHGIQRGQAAAAGTGPNGEGDTAS